MANNNNAVPNPDYQPTTWEQGMIITAKDLNDMEEQIDELVEAVPEIIKVSDNTPNSPYNQVWIKKGEPITLAQMDDFNTFCDSFAPTYTKGNNYEVGDYVIYNTVLYKCKQKVTNAPEQLDQSAWSKVYLIDDITNLIKVQDTQPTSELNKLWLTSTPDQGVTLATYQDFINIIAEEYSITKLYKTGDYVIHDGHLYRRLNDASNPGNWTQSNWVAVTLSGEIQAANEEVQTINGEIQTIGGEIQSINGEIQTINGSLEDHDSMMASIATEYDPTKTYNVNDYCWYNSKLYRCNTTIGTAEAWNTGHWAEAVFGGELSSLKTSVKTAINNDRTLLEYEVSSGINKLNPSTIVPNSSIGNNSTLSNYGEVISGEYNVSDFIPVNGGDTVSWFYNNDATATSVVRTTMFRVAEYDENKTVISVSANWIASPFSTTPNTRFVRVVLLVRPLNMIVLNATGTTMPYSAYVEAEKFKRIDEIETDVDNIETEIDELKSQENPFEIILPSAVYGVTGQQINIYKQNLMLHNRLKSLAYIHTRIEHSYQTEERTIWNPNATELTEYVKNVEIFANGFGQSYAAYKSVKYYEVPKDTGNGNIKVLIAGDSKVDNGYVSYHFLHNFDDDNMTCTLLGTKYDWQTDNRNEGYGGKTAEWFCTNPDSPFSNGGVCDFANYLSSNNIDTPDYVFINLGTNDSAGKSAESGEFPGNFTTYITQMIDSIHAVSPNIVVIVGMCEGAATVKDTNNAEFLKWDINEKISRLHKVTVELYDNRQSENIYVCPMYMGMDLTQDYNMTEEPLSSRDGDVNTGKTRMLITDRIHQNEVGYWKNADYMYALVKYIVAKSLV